MFRTLTVMAINRLFLMLTTLKDLLDIYKAGDSFNKDEQRMIISAVTGQIFFIGSTELRTSARIIAGNYVKSLFEEQTAEQYEQEENNDKNKKN